MVLRRRIWFNPRMIIHIAFIPNPPRGVTLFLLSTLRRQRVRCFPGNTSPFAETPPPKQNERIFFCQRGALISAFHADARHRKGIGTA
ncbi:hypothetical protein L596_002934 [Steinernema carpocapsae]|uniref:Uncharacterized protein n=1 Tax=Steinernema carpocapsae TaxID=34508 RepID=A0A4U8URK6_STECR|nr:hypothetical protein L596_002934 [Steinernema carpocapsae]